MNRQHLKDNEFKSGFATIVGRPNTGKSTLINKLAEKKIAAISDKPQTTRHTIKAILNDRASQIVLIDTPGIQKPRNEFDEQLNKKVLAALNDVDAIIFLVDGAAGIGAGDMFIASVIRKVKTVKIGVVNKMDIMSDNQINEQKSKLNKICELDYAIEISAEKGTGLDLLVEKLKNTMPPGPKYFPDGMITDQPESLLIAEIIREKAMNILHDEVPHSMFVHVDSVKLRKNKDIIDIEAIIFVERQSQKGIVVGKEGKIIKSIGTQARTEVEALLGKKVFLDLRIKVRKKWRKDKAFLQKVGF